MSVLTQDFVLPADRRQQRSAALEKANRVRFQRVLLKREIREGRVRLADVLVDPPPYIRSMRLADLVMSVPLVGQSKLNHLMRSAELRSSWRVGDLTARQAGVLVDEMRERGWL